jgi:uncharacterized protein YqfB (UPF0267 family)
MRLSAKYKPGTKIQVNLKDVFHHKAEVVSIRKFRLDTLNELIAGLDTGYSLTETKNILYRMYPKADWATQDIYLILLKKCDDKPADLLS